MIFSSLDLVWNYHSRSVGSSHEMESVTVISHQQPIRLRQNVIRSTSCCPGRGADSDQDMSLLRSCNPPNNFFCYVTSPGWCDPLSWDNNKQEVTSRLLCTTHCSLNGVIHTSSSSTGCQLLIRPAAPRRRMRRSYGPGILMNEAFHYPPPAFVICLYLPSVSLPIYPKGGGCVRQRLKRRKERWHLNNICHSGNQSVISVSKKCWECQRGIGRICACVCVSSLSLQGHPDTSQRWRSRVWQRNGRSTPQEFSSPKINQSLNQ